MAKRKRSEEGAIIAYFSLSPLEQAESLLSIIQELVRRRRGEGKPRAKKVKPEPLPLIKTGIVGGAHS